MMKSLLVVSAVSLAALSFNASAHPEEETAPVAKAAPVGASHHSMDATASAKQGSHGAHAAMSDGEIKKIDKGAKKVTIKHGPLANLDMPGMTMVFRVKEIAMLDQIKVGNKVKFSAEKLNGALTVTMIDVAK